MMQRKSGITSWVLAFMMIVTYILPIGTQTVLADVEAFISIYKITQTTQSLQPGDTFSLKVDVNAYKIGSDKMYISNATASGDGIETSQLGFTVEGDAEVKENIGGGEPLIQTVIISGLKYTGESKKISVTVECGPSYMAEGQGVIASAPVDFELVGKTSGDLKDAVVIDKQENLLVKSGQTQSAQVKVRNQSAMTINNADLKLTMLEKVEGIDITNGSAKISNLKPKEIKSVSFSVKVGDEVKAGVYKANIEVLGDNYPVNLQVDSHVVPSVLEVVADDSKIFNPGVAQDAIFKIRNVGDRPAKNIRVEITSESIAIMGGSNVKHIDVINAKSMSEISMKLKVDGAVKQSSVPLKVDMSYLNSLGEEVKDTQYVYLSTSASGASSEVIIDNVYSPAGSYGVDQNFNVKFSVSSKGGAESLKISVKGDEGIVPKSQNLFFVSKLAIGEKKQYSVTFAATRAAVSSTHPIEITVEYGGGSAPITISQYSSVNISNPEKEEEGSETKKGTPKVIIGYYKCEPVVVRAGEQFDLEIGFLNAHKTQAVHNLKANLAIREEGEKNTGSVFTPVGASNTFYIADLLPGETEVKKIKLYTIPSASPKTYEVTLEMEYEDSKGTEIKAVENIGIPVEQTTKVEIGDVQVDYAQVGMPAYFNATIYNTGKTEISNMMIHIEGEGFTVQENKMFIGVFEKGATENYAPMIIADMPGNLKGNIIIEYEEATGEQKTISKEFTLEVAEMPIEPDISMEDPSMMPQPSVPKWPLVLGIGFGIVIALIVTAVVLKKRKDKREMMMLDEDD